MKFTFKTVKSTGRYACFYPDSHIIKLNKKKVGSIVLIMTIIISSCTDKNNAKKALERSGYKPINVGGYGWFAGSQDDLYVTKFKAIAPNGDTVTGCVTSGWFKGNTIRIND